MSASLFTSDRALPVDIKGLNDVTRFDNSTPFAGRKPPTDATGVGVELIWDVSVATLTVLLVPDLSAVLFNLWALSARCR